MVLAKVHRMLPVIKIALFFSDALSFAFFSQTFKCFSLPIGFNRLSIVGINQNEYEMVLSKKDLWQLSVSYGSGTQAWDLEIWKISIAVIFGRGIWIPSFRNGGAK